MNTYAIFYDKSLFDIREAATFADAVAAYALTDEHFQELADHVYGYRITEAQRVVIEPPGKMDHLPSAVETLRRRAAIEEIHSGRGRRYTFADCRAPAAA
jgi:hypothetical protein